MGRGTFTFARTPKFIVQYQSTNLNSDSPTYNVAMALQYGECVYTIHVKNFSPRGFKCGKSGIKVISNPKKKQIAFHLPEESQVIVIRSSVDVRVFLDLRVYVAYYAVNKVSGVCGPFGGKLANKLFLLSLQELQVVGVLPLWVQPPVWEKTEICLLVRQEGIASHMESRQSQQIPVLSLSLKSARPRKALS